MTDDTPKMPTPKLPPVPGPRPALDVRRLEGLDAAVKEINEVAARHKPNTPPEYRFMELSEKACEAMLEAARQQVNMAQNNLKRVEAWAEQMRSETKQRWEEHEAYVRSLEEFSVSLLDANRRFHKSNGKD